MSLEVRKASGVVLRGLVLDEIAEEDTEDVMEAEGMNARASIVLSPQELLSYMEEAKKMEQHVGFTRISK